MVATVRPEEVSGRLDMTRYGTRLNVLWTVVALLTGLSQLSKAAEGNGFAIVVALAAAILFVVALTGAVRSSQESGK
jgi:hypothetical protein